REQQLRGQLRLEVEADAAQADAVQRLAPEHLVGRLHVAETRAEQEVRKPRQSLVGDARLERNRSSRSKEPRAVDDVRVPRENRREQAAVFLRVELEVGVLNQDNVAGRVLQ